MKKVSLSEEWGEENAEQPQSDYEVKSDALVIRKVALMADDNLVGTIILLLKGVLGQTLDSIGLKLNELSKKDFTRQAVYEQCQSLSVKFPSMSASLLDKSELKNILLEPGDQTNKERNVSWQILLKRLERKKSKQ